MAKAFLYQALAGVALGALVRGVGIGLTRRLARVEPERMLNADEMASMAPHARRAERKATFAPVAFAVLCTYPFAHALFWINIRVFDVANNAAYDGRRMEWWLVPGIVLAFALGVLFAPMFARAGSSIEGDRLDRYFATRDGVDPNRSSVVWCLLIALIAIPVGWMSWSNGIIIDERGISLRLAWYHDVRTYADVSAVERCLVTQTLDSSRSNEAVRIHFSRGKPVTIRDGVTRVSPEDADRIASYVAQRAGCRITRSTEPCRSGSTPVRLP
ncbi:MAG: hypothetical protein JXB13_06165 [Phycisphaerae bacterium]|nr:hypothetical protein [Phycisphaerae bacterium]